VPSTVAAVFAAASLEAEGVVRWGGQVGDTRSGVYAVALTDEPDALNVLSAAPIAKSAIERLLAVRPGLTLDGRRPSEAELAERIAGFWLPDETIVYIGLATSLRSRVRSFYRTPVGAKRPHSGGWFLKTLANLESLYVHFACVGEYDDAEAAMLEGFVAAVSPTARAEIADPEHPWPFGNLELRRGGRKIRKRHGIKGARGELSSQI
jgi:hypothetical protein